MDEVEKPMVRTLYRQSSIETRLIPNPPSEDSDSSDYENYEHYRPRIVDVIVKVTPPSEKPTDHVNKPVTEIQPQNDPPQNTARKNSPPRDNKVSNSSQKEVSANRKVREVSVNSEVEKVSVSEVEISSSKRPVSEFAVTLRTKDTEKYDLSKDSEEGEFKPANIHEERKTTTESSNSYLEVLEYRRPVSESVGTLRSIGYKSASRRTNMASPRPKSPRPAVSAKNDKEESFWEKIGTLGRKKRIRKVQDVQDEGKYAIDSPGSPTAPDLPPEEYALEENEERSMIEPRSFEDPKLKELISVLIEWINDELADQRIIVKDIDEDLYDGQVLQKLIEKLSGEKLDVPEVTQSEEGQKQKLGIVLQAANRILGPQRWLNQKWSVESVHSKNIVAILHLLVTLARHFRAPVRLPENVAVGVVVVQKRDGSLSHRTVMEEITSTYDDLGMRCERDAFDTLFDHAPDKLQVVKKSLVTFVNKQLNKVNLEVNDLDTQFHDGVYLTLLMGLLEGFFVPLFSFHLTPQTFEQKVHNVQFAFELMQDVGIAKPKARPEDIVNLDLKSTLRVLYNLFTKYKSIS